MPGNPGGDVSMQGPRLFLWASACLAACRAADAAAAGPPFEHYSLDGTGNNRGNPAWGARLTPQIHRYKTCFADGIAAPRFVANGEDPNSTNSAYRHCVEQCRVEQARLGGAGGTWTYEGRGPVTIDARGHACDYACNDLLGANARTVSNRIFTNLKLRQVLSPKRANDLHTYFGHLLSHEMHHSRHSSGGDAWPIRVPECDAWWDPECKGTVTQEFVRFDSAAGSGTGDKRLQPLNYLTSWIDGNTLYGGDDAGGAEDRFHMLRTGSASNTSFTSCKLKLEEKPDFSGLAPHEYHDVPADPLGYLQFNNGMDMFRTAGPPGFAGGDFRANVDPGILGLATVFSRMHNRLCDRFSKEQPDNTPQQNFWLVRKWIIAYMQKIFYYEYIPALLGKPLPPYVAYDPDENPAFDPYHTHAAMRYGHSEVNEVFMRLDAEWKAHPLGHLLFREGILNPAKALETGLDPILRGLMAQPQGRVDTYLIDPMVNGLFGGPVRRPWTVTWDGHCLAKRGSGSTTAHGVFDLQATNIQRGREQGLCGINSVRTSMGLAPYGSWQELVLGIDWASVPANDPGYSLVQDLEAMYGPDVDNGDFWIACLAEHKNDTNSNLGPTFSRVVSDNWSRLRRADRFHFENSANGLFTPAEVTSILTSSLSEIIRSTTRVTPVPDRAFFVPETQMVTRADPIATPSLPAFNEFNHTMMLSPYFKLAWSFIPEARALDMAVAAPTLGWVGIGFVKEDSHAMMNSDMVVGRIDNSMSMIDDMYSDAITPPVRDIDRSPMGADDLQNKYIEQENGVTSMYFRKPIWSNDPWDRVVGGVAGKVKMAFAFQPQGLTTLEYHGATRGYADVQLFAPDCPFGTFLDTMGMTCKMCPQGRFRTQDMALTKCALCPMGTFQHTLGGASCVACTNVSIPGSSTLFLGATSAADCVCPKDTYFVRGLCSRCMAGLSCPGGLGSPLQAAGYSVQALGADGTVSVWACAVATSCPAGGMATCSRGTTGVMCTSCAEQGHYWSPTDSICHPCSGSGAWWIIPTTLLLCGIIMVLVYKYSLSWGDREKVADPVELGVTMALALFLAQSAAVYKRLAVPWKTPIGEMLMMASYFDFDFGFLRLDCALGSGFWGRYIFGSCFPLVIMLIYGLASLILTRRGRKDASLRCWNSVGLLTACLFIGLLQHGIAPFITLVHPNGQRSMLESPEVVYGSVDHMRLSVCGVIHLVGYGGGFIAYCLYACWQLHHRARSKDSRGIRAVLWHRFLFVKFKPQRYYWGVVKLFRSTAIAVIPVIFEAPQLQIVLLQLTLCAFLGLQTFFWPYRSELHNVADVTVCSALIALTLAASFFLPDNDSLGNRSVVVAVILCFSSCAIVFLCVVGAMCIACIKRSRMTEEQRAQAKENLLKDRTSFYAELQRVEESELTVLEAEERTIDVDAVCDAPLPELQLSALLRANPSKYGSGDLEILFTAPSEHPYMREVQKCLRVLEERLRCRVQELVDSRNNTRAAYSRSVSFASVVPMHIQRLDQRSFSSVVWNEKERQWISRLSARTLGFQSAYVKVFRGNPEATSLLQIFVTRMEQRFQGVYQACVNDMLVPQPGYARAVGTARVLQQLAQKTEDGGKTVADIGKGEYAALMEAAVRTQEATIVYAEGLAAATRGKAPRTSIKHLYRILEKQALDPKSTLGGELRCWDTARMMLLYDCMDDLARGVEQLCSDHMSRKIEVLRVKERFSEPTTGGWSDILVNLRFPKAFAQLGQLPFELQLAHSQMMVIRKDMGGHHGYAKYRSAKEILELLSALEGANYDSEASIKEEYGKASKVAHDQEDTRSTMDVPTSLHSHSREELAACMPLPGVVARLAGADGA